MTKTIKHVSPSNLIRNGMTRRPGKGTGRSNKNLLVVRSNFCWICKQKSYNLKHISPGRKRDELSSWICEECYPKAQDMRKCHSKRDKCKDKICYRCKSETAECRFVRVLTCSRNYNSHSQFHLYESEIEDEEDPGGEVRSMCQLCISTKYGEGIVGWSCKSDYLTDHSLAKCSSCGLIDLNFDKFYGRGRCCRSKINK